MTSESISGCVVSNTSFIDSTSSSIEWPIALRTSWSVTLISRGSPVTKSRPRTMYSSVILPGAMEAMAIFVSSALLSPMSILNSLRTWPTISVLNLSPAMRTLREFTKPPSAITPMSVVPPPMSMTMLPRGSWTGSSMPIAAAIGSSMMWTSRAPADLAASRTARTSTEVMPEGIPMTTRGPRSLVCPACAFPMRYESISEVTSKSDMTPSTTGCTATMCAGVLPSMSFACWTTATTCPVFWFIATIDGSLMTMPRPFTYTSVFAVPRSIPMSLEKRPSTRSLHSRNRRVILLILFREAPDDVALGYHRRRSVGACHDLDASRRHRFLRNHHAHRYTDEVRVCEFLARADIAVIIEGLDAVFGKEFVEAIGFRDYFRIAAGNGNEMHGEGRDFFRPYNSLFVGEHFHDGAHEASRADTV